MYFPKDIRKDELPLDKQPQNIWLMQWTLCDRVSPLFTHPYPGPSTTFSTTLNPYRWENWNSNMDITWLINISWHRISLCKMCLNVLFAYQKSHEAPTKGYYPCWSLVIKLRCKPILRLQRFSLQYWNITVDWKVWNERVCWKCLERVEGYEVQMETVKGKAMQWGKRNWKEL